MSFFKFFNLKSSLKNKILVIKNKMQNIISANSGEKFWIEWYGAYDIDPKYLVYWICVQSDKTKINLESDHELMGRLRHLLTKYNYPESARDLVQIGIESQENVDRESDGDWYAHFK